MIRRNCLPMCIVLQLRIRIRTRMNLPWCSRIIRLRPVLLRLERSSTARLRDQGEKCRGRISLITSIWFKFTKVFDSTRCDGKSDIPSRCLPSFQMIKFGTCFPQNCQTSPHEGEKVYTLKVWLSDDCSVLRINAAAEHAASWRFTVVLYSSIHDIKTQSFEVGLGSDGIALRRLTEDTKVTQSTGVGENTDRVVHPLDSTL